MVKAPPVCVLTPIHNAAPYLAECIESVLAQTYSNWHYILVDNCSSDDSRQIAETYASRDSRIRVIKTGAASSTIASYNFLMRQLSPNAKYCKIIFAEDWIYPGCIEEMVRLAEQHPNVGLVGAYTMDGRAVLWQGPLHSVNPGRDVCREFLLGGPYLLGSMSSLLIRSELIPKCEKIFDEEHPHREIGACFEILRRSDYGYIHQVLSFRRQRTRETEPFALEAGTCALGSVVDCLKYGPLFLNASEYQQALRNTRWRYYRILATNLFRRSPQFWRFHKDTLAAFGSRMDYKLLALCAILKVAGLLARPLHSVRDAWRWSRVENRRASQVTAGGQ